MTTTLSPRPPRSLMLPDGRELEVGVRASSVAQTMRIRLGADQPAEILVPAAASTEDIDRALRSKARWIADKLMLIEQRSSAPPVLGLDQPGRVWLDGVEIPVARVEGDRSQAHLRDGTLYVGGPEPGRAVRRWYQRQARARALDLVQAEADRLGLQPNTISVRDQRTRWGSCSPSGALSVNWRLALAPAHVQRYVVVHELCHLSIANHRKPFWRLLDSALPEWRDADAWLRRHGDELRRYDVRLAVS